MNQKFDKLDDAFTGMNKAFDSIDDHFKAINESFDNIEKNLKCDEFSASIFIASIDEGHTYTKRLQWNDSKVLAKLRELFELPQDAEIVGIHVSDEGISLSPRK